MQAWNQDPGSTIQDQKSRILNPHRQRTRTQAKPSTASHAPVAPSYCVWALQPGRPGPARESLALFMPCRFVFCRLVAVGGSASAGVLWLCAPALLMARRVGQRSHAKE